MNNVLDKRQARRARRRAALTPVGVEVWLASGKYLTHSWRRTMDEARKRESRLIQRPCSEGRCVELIDPETGENTGGWGPVDCPCEDA